MVSRVFIYGEKRGLYLRSLANTSQSHQYKIIYSQCSKIQRTQTYEFSPFQSPVLIWWHRRWKQLNWPVVAFLLQRLSRGIKHPMVLTGTVRGRHTASIFIDQTWKHKCCILTHREPAHRALIHAHIWQKCCHDSQIQSHLTGIVSHQYFTFQIILFLARILEIVFTNDNLHRFAGALHIILSRKHHITNNTEDVWYS